LACGLKLKRLEEESDGYEIIVDDIYKTIDHLTDQGTGKI
jgi:hypothetical protein